MLFYSFSSLPLAGIYRRLVFTYNFVFVKNIFNFNLVILLSITCFPFVTSICWKKCYLLMVLFTIISFLRIAFPRWRLLSKQYTVLTASICWNSVVHEGVEIEVIVGISFKLFVKCYLNFIYLWLQITIKITNERVKSKY